MTKNFKLEVGGYYRLRDGTEVQIVEREISRGEDYFYVRYPDEIMSGDSYGVEWETMRQSQPSKKYHYMDKVNGAKSK